MSDTKQTHQTFKPSETCKTRKYVLDTCSSVTVVVKDEVERNSSFPNVRTVQINILSRIASTKAFTNHTLVEVH